MTAPQIYRSENATSPLQPIAIIGLGFRLPGGAADPEELWQALYQGHDAVTEGPFDRWDVDAFYTPEPDLPGRTVSRWAGLLEDIAAFDAEFFGIGAREADAMDPQARLLLEVGWEALERAGIPPRGLEGRPVGVFAGLCHTDYLMRMAGRYEEIEAYTSSGSAHSTAVGRLSYLLGLRGPSVAVDTACSSSLVAIHFAVQSLRSGECELALAGGANVLVTPDPGLSYSRWGMLSPRGRCRPFDASADGYVRGEGAGMVALKRLADAQRDGDPVLAVIRASAVNQDGRSNGLTAPSPEAQRALLRAAVQAAGVPPCEIGMVEAHGTGTPVGDPIEFSALSDVYGPGDMGSCALGSLKSNIGHLEAAAGIAGLIKTVLCLNKATVVPSLHFDQWNPRIDTEGSRLFVPQRPQTWPVHASTRLAGVSGFGFSGTNAHVILESFEAPQLPPAPREKGPMVFTLSAASTDGLATSARRLANHLSTQDPPPSLSDIAHTLAVRRSSGRERLGVVAHNHDELVEHLLTAARGDAPEAARALRATARAGAGSGSVWVFPGQGTQWGGMGRALLDTDPAFTAVIDSLEPLVAHESGFSLREALTDSAVVSGIATVQPALFAMQVALAECWREQGVQPAAVIGHSMGEVAAAVVAGVLSLDDGARVICRRSSLMARLAGQGAMAVVELEEARVRDDIAAHGDVCVAALSAPQSTVISGATDTVRQLVDHWSAGGITARLIQVDVASHSAMVDPILDELHKSLEGIGDRSAVPQGIRPVFYSTVLEDPTASTVLDAAYWCANLRQPVRFHHAVTAAAADHCVFVEVSPHPALTSAVRNTVSHRAKDPLVIGTLFRDDGGPATLRRGLATLWAHGLEVDWSRTCGSGRLTGLPVTSWNRHRHWIDLPTPHPDLSSATLGRGEHPLLGPHLTLPPPATGHLWQTDIGTDALPWLGDHVVHGDAALPVAVFAEMALAAACQAFSLTGDQVHIRDLSVQQMLTLSASTEVSITATPAAEGTLRCDIRTQTPDTGAWTVHATAELVPTPAIDRPTPEEDDTWSIGPAVTHTVTAAAFGSEFRHRGVSHGESFRILSGLEIAVDQAHVRASGLLDIPADLRTTGRFQLHPRILDACLQTLSASLVHTNTALDVAPLPVGIEELRLVGNPARAARCQTWLTTADSGFQGDFRLLDPEGDVVAEGIGVRFARYARGPQRLDRLFHELTWTPAPLTDPVGPAHGRWIVCAAPHDVLTERIAERLRTAGAHVESCPLPSGGTADAGDDTPRLAAFRTRLEDVLAAPTPGGVPATHVVVLVPGGDTHKMPSQRATELTSTISAVARACANVDTGTTVRYWAVTRGGHAVEPGEAPGLAQMGVAGIVHVLRWEHPELLSTLIDLDPLEPSPEDLETELRSGQDASQVAWRAGVRRMAQITPTPWHDGTWRHRPRRIVAPGEEDAVALATPPGDEHILQPVVHRRQDVRPDEIEIQVRAAGLAPVGPSQKVGGPARPVVGVVTRTGEAVTAIHTGQRVVGWAAGAASTYAVLRADDSLLVPQALDDAIAVTLPAAACAWHALCAQASLTSGAYIWIHDAGQASMLPAVAIALAAGAHVLATADTEEARRQLAARGVILVGSHAGDADLDEIRRITHGHGCDIVLCPAGVGLDKNLRALANGGRLLLAVDDSSSGPAPLDWTAVPDGASVLPADLTHAPRGHHKAANRALRHVMQQAMAKTLPLPAATAIPLSQVTGVPEAGRILDHPAGSYLEMTPEPISAVVAPTTYPLTREDGAYLITGGLGSLGLCTARWLSARGARRVILNGRSAPDRAAAQAIAELRAGGTTIEVVQGDIAEPGTAERLVAAAEADGSVLRGVLHAALAVHDGPLAQLEFHDLDPAWRAKVDGAWRLHEATAERPLDWWVTYSSLSALIGMPHLAAYASANAWLDGFAAWRRAQGLPATSVDWGLWAGSTLARPYEEQGHTAVEPEDALEALGVALDHERTHTAIFVPDTTHWFADQPALAQLPLFAALPAPALPEQSHAAPQALPALLAHASPSQKEEIWTDFLWNQLCEVLGRRSTQVEPHTPFVALGLDSLGAMRLRQRVTAVGDASLSATAIWRYPTPALLAHHLAHQEPRQNGGGPDASSPPLPPQETTAAKPRAHSAGGRV